jgi:hypothetical protein
VVESLGLRIWKSEVSRYERQWRTRRSRNMQSYVRMIDLSRRVILRRDEVILCRLNL